MIRNTYGRKLWSFPGGGIRGEETAEDAVKRETMEEVGIRIENPQEIGIFTSQLEFKRDTVTVFKADALSRNLKIDPIEILEAEWFSPDNLPIVSGYAKKIMSMWNNKEV
ncbi:NUDIX hydrolase [Patescibacteria group bacterium]|nr:NUDIX hydrolase [Patescibacteria group bacterium]